MNEAQAWQRAESVFHAVADLPPAEQKGVVASLCSADINLSTKVVALLREDAAGPWLVDENADKMMSSIAAAVLDTDSSHSMPYHQVGPYRLIRVLGEGGMGVVYLAERDDIGGQFALKFLRDAWLSPMRRERFALEQQTLVKLNHPSIARIYDASTTDDGIPWFVMEYVEGLPFIEFLRKRQGPVREDLQVFQQVCEAVRYAHSLAVVHRDLKPSNVLVTPEGRVKLLDFGIAKQMTDSKAEDRTVTGLRLLTPRYAAPEQRNGQAVGTFTDVYSLGVLLYEMLTGQLPKIPEKNPERPTETPSKIARNAAALLNPYYLSRREWADLDVLCLTCLAGLPKDRYRSVDSLLRDLHAFLQGRVLEARRPSTAYRIGKFVRRNRWQVLSTAAVLLIVMVLSVVFTVRLNRERKRAVAEVARTRRIQDFMMKMLGNADGEAGPAQELTVKTLLDREAQQADLLHDDPETRVELEQTIGTMYNRLGSYEKSEQILKCALQQAEIAGSPAGKEIPAVLVELVALRCDRGDTHCAQVDIQRAVALANAEPTIGRDGILAQARIALGRAYVMQGKTEEAVAQLTPVAEDRLPGVQIQLLDQRDAFAAIAVAQTNAVHLDQAEAASRRALDLDHRLLGDTHIQTGIDWSISVSIEATRRNLPEAEALYLQGIAIMSAWYGPESPDEVTASGLLAFTLSVEHKDVEAASILRNVLPIQQKVYGNNHVRMAATLSTLGGIAVRRNDLSEARDDYARAAAIDKAKYGDNNPATAVAISNLANVYLKRNDAQQAEPLLRAFHPKSLLQSEPMLS